MRHYMKLKPDPFLSIAMDQKTIELRLYDEKRQALKVGDQILFSRDPKIDYAILVEITHLHLFQSFKELYATLDLKNCGYTEETIKTAAPSDMDKYYPLDEQSQFGVVGIEFKRIQTIDLTKNT